MEQSGKITGDISCKTEFDPAPSRKMYFVYLLKNKRNKSLYYGYTNDLERRMAEHNKKDKWNLIYYEAYKSENDARRRESKLKDYGQALTALKERVKDSLL